MQKVRRHFLKISTAYRITNSSLFHYVNNTILFKLSFTVLFAIAKFIILSLRGWSPYIPTSYLSSYLFINNFYKFTGLLPFLVTIFLLFKVN
jgi:hypothetical protein